jgi:hypothetical protein
MAKRINIKMTALAVVAAGVALEFGYIALHINDVPAGDVDPVTKLHDQCAEYAVSRRDCDRMLVEIMRNKP